MGGASSEILKSLIQLVGAAAIAWLAVRWALSRFKAERMWERQFAVFSELLTAVFDLSRMLQEWNEHYLKVHFMSEKRIEELREEYERQRRRIRESAILAAIVAPADAAEKIAAVESDLNEAFDRELGDHQSLKREIEILNDAKVELLAVAWNTLGTRDLHRPRLLHDPKAWFKMKNTKRLSYGDQTPT